LQQYPIVLCIFQAACLTEQDMHTCIWEYLGDKEWLSAGFGEKVFQKSIDKKKQQQYNKFSVKPRQFQTR
jgi:hypothetical protein